MENKPFMVARESLWQFTKDVFVQIGMSPEDAGTEADVLIWANLRGVDSHGVQRIPGYVNAAQSGRMKVKANIRVEKDMPSMALIDADRAFGPVVTVSAMEMAISKAQQTGIGWILIRNTSHQGAMGYYSLMAARRNMIGIALVCSPPNTAPYGARVAGVHNSPIAIAAPGKNHPPLILDMATSVAAFGKLDVARDKNVPIPVGWAIDKEGRPCTDPFQAACLLPFGSYKGSGLALMFECMSSLMVGNPLLGTALTGQKEKLARSAQNSVVAAINISMWTDVESYKEHVDEVAGAIKALPTAEGFDEVMVPGEPEDRVDAQRRKDGIPLPAGTVRRLQEVAQALQIEMPPAL